MIRTRIVGLLAVLPLIGLLCFAASRFGPGPFSDAVKLETNKQPASGSAATDNALPVNSQLFQLFGIYQTAVAQGRVNTSASEYLNAVETIYRQRGYEKFTLNELPTKRSLKSKVRSPRLTTKKFFHRQETNGMSTIWATGNDADYNTDASSSEPFTFSTLVTSSESGGAEWATYRMQIDHAKVKQLSKLTDHDFPGSDPLNIPRPKGLHRIYAFTSARGSIAMYNSNDTEVRLTARYLEDMQRRGWNLDAEVTANANKVTRGVMCFTMGQRFCMIWITPGKDPNTSTVTISSY